MTRCSTWIVATLACACSCAAAAETNSAPDLSRERVLYEVGYSHLDTQWRWTYPQVIREFIPNTVHENLPLFEKYPHYVFNWSGANRYRLMQEYHPDDFAKVREWVAKGRWFPAGSSWEENDVNVPSTESLVRQILFGHEYFMKEFGRESCEYLLPDCFGFPASLPSVLAHCGLRGFSTQKLTWGSAVGVPFNVGVWEGPDGQSVIAAFNPGAYIAKVTNDLSASASWLERLNQDGAKSGVFADFAYYGVGDRGGAPDDKSVGWIEKSATGTGPVRVISARAEQMFQDITDAQKARLPRYKGDLLLTEHSAGSITSQAYMKRWNRMNELLADAAERASVAAHLLGAAPYPREQLHRAWELVLGAQFHDLLPGTSVPKAYEYTWNDEIIAMNSFASVLQNAVGAVARSLDTRAEGAPLVVFNPLSIQREDVVEAELEFPTGTTAVQVCDGDGKLLPTQTLSSHEGKTRFLFLAKVPPVGFAVFSARAAAVPSAKSALKVAERSLENARYRVTLNEAGDLAGVFDKTARRELLSGPARLAFLTEHPNRYPAWNMDWKDRTNAPRGYVSGPAKIRIVEDGPVRVALEVERAAENSIFLQTIRLSAGAAGDRVEIASRVDWQSTGCSLKAEFPLAVGNPLATYNWELGKIQRGNNDPKKYEVPSHQWFDLTEPAGHYGVSILSGAKYGSDKPADNLLRLTLLYSPGTGAKSYPEQRWQDWGRHEFAYGLYGHKGDWRKGESDWQAARLEQPLLAFRTSAHEGRLGRSFSLLHPDSERVAVRTIKLEEEGDQVIVRLQELNGAPTKAVSLAAAAGVTDAVEVNGVEKLSQPLEVRRGALKLDFKPYQLRSVALRLTTPAKLAPPVSVPVELPYNLDAFSFNDGAKDGAFDEQGANYPAEMIGDSVVSQAIRFQIGPRANGRNNAVSCQGQRIALPAGTYNRLYLLAAAAGGDTEGAFTVDGSSTLLRVQNWSGYIGQWDNRVFQGRVSELTYAVTNRLDHLDAGFIKRDPLAWFCSHRHLADGSDDIYCYSYLFEYRLDLPAGAKTLTLPNNPRLRVFAISAAQNDNDATQPARPLYDDFTGRGPVILRAPVTGSEAVSMTGTKTRASNR
jgi:alpha-mannosidase